MTEPTDAPQVESLPAFCPLMPPGSPMHMPSMWTYTIGPCMDPRAQGVGGVLDFCIRSAPGLELTLHIPLMTQDNGLTFAEQLAMDLRAQGEQRPGLIVPNAGAMGDLRHMNGHPHQ